MNEQDVKINGLSRFHCETIFFWAFNMELDDTKRLSTQTMRRVIKRNVRQKDIAWDTIVQALRGGE